ncbi:MAG: hypothetical protein QM784_08510 [Polyangiaceae bacterium]
MYPSSTIIRDQTLFALLLGVREPAIAQVYVRGRLVQAPERDGLWKPTLRAVGVSASEAA